MDEILFVSATLKTYIELLWKVLVRLCLSEKPKLTGSVDPELPTHLDAVNLNSAPPYMGLVLTDGFALFGTYRYLQPPTILGSHFDIYCFSYLQSLIYKPSRRYSSSSYNPTN